MNIRFLETVIWLSELRNFRITAARMNMTPAAISNRIGAIEQELGFRLFERDARDVSLTAEGEVFVEGARDIVLRYHNLVESVSPKNSVEGQLKLGIVPSLAMTILPDVLDILRQRYPKIRISITTDSSKVLTQQLEQRELDIVFAIRPDTAASSDLDIANIDAQVSEYLAKSAMTIHYLEEYGKLIMEDNCFDTIVSHFA